MSMNIVINTSIHQIIAEWNGILHEKGSKYLISVIEPVGKNRLFALIDFGQGYDNKSIAHTDVESLCRSMVRFGLFKQEFLEERYGIHFSGWKCYQ